jgi:hypothetical protein
MMRAARFCSVLFVLTLALATPGCKWLHEHLKSCDDVDVRLINDEQTRDAYNLVGPDESPSPDNLVPSGMERRRRMCLELGHSKRFRAFRDSTLASAAQCIPSRADYDSVDVRVRWTPIGFICENW